MPDMASAKGTRETKGTKGAKATKVATGTRAAAKPASPGKAYERRADFGAGIDAYVGKLSPPTRQIVEAMVGLVQRAVPAATAEIKWGMPVFSKDGLLCYLRGGASYVRFGFYDHVGEMDDPEGQLEGSSESGGHVKLRSVDDIDEGRFTSWLQTAARKNTAG
jgi:hypothetical protein